MICAVRGQSALRRHSQRDLPSRDEELRALETAAALRCVALRLPLLGECDFGLAVRAFLPIVLDGIWTPRRLVTVTAFNTCACSHKTPPSFGDDELGEMVPDEQCRAAP